MILLLILPMWDLVSKARVQQVRRTYSGVPGGWLEAATLHGSTPGPRPTDVIIAERSRRRG